MIEDQYVFCRVHGNLLMLVSDDYCEGLPVAEGQLLGAVVRLNFASFEGVDPFFDLVSGGVYDFVRISRELVLSCVNGVDWLQNSDLREFINIGMLGQMCFKAFFGPREAKQDFTLHFLAQIIKNFVYLCRIAIVNK